LHVFGTLNRVGGAEKWILDLLQMKDPRVRFDFLISLDENSLTPEVQRLGSVVYRVPFSKSPLPYHWSNPYLSGVRKILRNNNYDAIHVHQFDLSGEILRIAAQERVAVRVMSVHAAQYENPRFYRRLVHRFFGRSWIFRYATDILPCSQTVAESFAPSAQKIPTAKQQLLYTGIDPALFLEASRRRNEIRPRLRKELGIPDHAVVLGHIGRFTQQKNHRFLLELMEFLQNNPLANTKTIAKNTADTTRDSLDNTANNPAENTDNPAENTNNTAENTDNPAENTTAASWYAVLVGQGEQRDEIRCEIQNKKIQNRVILTGFRSDIPDLFCSLFDVFLLPSFYEGLPIAAMEALAAGLGVVYSDRISHELDRFFPQRIRRVSLDVPKIQWINAVHEMLAARCETPLAVTEWAATPFTLQASLEHLISIYAPHS
jgi:glycosyltransferase EpsF